MWTACLLFFQTFLLAGYTYTHLLTHRFSSRLQLPIHATVLIIALFHSTILPSQPPGHHHLPILELLKILIINVGFPFFALSTTAPLIQHWFFNRFPNRSPYPLYAVSNVGSFAAVVFYPFLFERYFPLSIQEHFWSIGFAFFCTACIGCGVLSVIGTRTSSASPAPTFPKTADTNEIRQVSQPKILWFGFSAVGSILLLTTTEQISQDIAASPLFWMIPLCIYLLTYVISFSSRRLYHRTFWLILLCLACITVGFQLFWAPKSDMEIQLLLYVFTLLIGCMVAHGELAAIKPPSEKLTIFYLWSSAGGIAGGVFVAVLAPFIFPELWEYSLAWLLLLFFVWRSLSTKQIDFEQSLRRQKLKWIVAVGLCISGIVLIVDVVYDKLTPSYVARNFYGRITISETKHTRCLYHGRTLHGCQPKTAKKLIPNFYYAPSSGIGISYTLLKQLHTETPIRTGIVGLGVGLCATWNQSSDTMRFYEIDPEISLVAKQKFDFLKRAQGRIDIRLGDARITLAKENQTEEPRLDLLVLDAFSSDAIPLHLLTREAFDIYRTRIKNDGILVFHISNRHVELEPLMLGAANHLKWQAFVVYTAEDYQNFILDTTWVILTNNSTFIQQLKKSDDYHPWPQKYKKPILFTDQYSNILELL